MFRTVLLKVIGKASISPTKDSALAHVYLSNDAEVFRLNIWKDQMPDDMDHMRIENVSLFGQCL
jgi:hypothetical protein